MNEEKKSAYFSVRARVGTMTTQKQLGLKEITIEVTYGNQDAIIIRNKDDVAKIEETTLAKKIWDEYENIKKEGKNRGYHFVEAGID